MAGTLRRPGRPRVGAARAGAGLTDEFSVMAVAERPVMLVELAGAC
jgi:hypothetical protein